MRRVLSLAAVFVLGGLALVSCGGGDHSNGSSGMGMDGMGMDESAHHGANAKVVSGARTIAVTAKSFDFAPTDIAIGAGEEVTITLTSEDGFHDFMVQGVGHVVGAKKGETDTGGLRIDQPGTYKFWCTVLGHRANGMQGTITVT